MAVIPRSCKLKMTLWYTSRCEMGLAASIRMATRLALIPQFRRAPDKLLGGNLLARAPPGRVARETFWVLTFAERFESLAIAKLYAIWPRTRAGDDAVTF